jgi:AraC-like DNA-binding protein
LAFVAANTATIQTTAQIAAELGLTPQYLSAYFSQHIGTPLKIYVQAKKIALAKDLLDRGADVTGACFDSGFNDCSYFIRVFKKYVGMTPLRYRQRRM